MRDLLKEVSIIVVAEMEASVFVYKHVWRHVVILNQFTASQLKITYKLVLTG